MDFDKPKVYGDTSITDGLVSSFMPEINIHISLYHFAYIGHIHHLVKCHPPLHNLHDVRGEEREKWGGCITGLWHSYATYFAESPQKKKDFLINTFKRHSLN